jgi:hypothetical protein
MYYNRILHAFISTLEFHLHYFTISILTPIPEHWKTIVYIWLLPSYTLTELAVIYMIRVLDTAWHCFPSDDLSVGPCFPSANTPWYCTSLMVDRVDLYKLAYLQSKQVSTGHHWTLQAVSIRHRRPTASIPYRHGDIGRNFPKLSPFFVHVDYMEIVIGLVISCMGYKDPQYHHWHSK